MHHDPAPCLILQPTIEMAETWSKDRLAPMLRDTPALRGRVADPRARDSGNTLLHKSFAGGHVTMAGANSPASLASRPIRLLFCDEVDRYPASAGTEGDPVALARKRTGTFWNRKIVEISSPTIVGTSRIAAAYEESDRRRFHVPCPHCGVFQRLEWERVRWEGDEVSTALYYCVECDIGWSDQQRWAAVRRGHWVAGAAFRGIAGFQLSELYSPWRRLAQTVGDFLEARGKPERLKVWRNTALGLPWQEAGEAPDWERLIERREPFPMGVVPAAAVALTAGVDNQNDPWSWRSGLGVPATSPGLSTRACSWAIRARRRPGMRWRTISPRTCRSRVAGRSASSGSASTLAAHTPRLCIHRCGAYGTTASWR